MDKLEAIYKLYPNTVKTVGDKAYDKDDNVISIDEDAINTEIANYAYITKRAQEYPSIADQLDYIYHNGIDAWKEDMIDPVKNKYPKG